MDCHFIREHLQRGAIITDYVPTKQQQADISTKALGAKSFHELSAKMGVHDPHYMLRESNEIQLIS